MPTTRLILSPHDDDQVLFAGLISMSPTKCDRTVVLIVFDSLIQPARGYPNCDQWRRRSESSNANEYIRATHLLHAGLSDAEGYSTPTKTIAGACKGILGEIIPTIKEIYAPQCEVDGHEQHNLVSGISSYICPPLTRGVVDSCPIIIPIYFYTTYTRTSGRTRTRLRIPATPDMIARKHQALACFRSQMQECTGCQEWFLGDINEYLA